MRQVVCFGLIALGWFAGAARAGEPPTRDEAARALRAAVAFFRTAVAAHGGYLWSYSGDLTLREGEGRVTGTDTAWVQPPGTPAVGLAFLAAYEATKDPYYLDAAREVAAALLKGQLRSGGWTARIEFAPAGRKRFAYRVDDPPGRWNVTSLDDNQTQEALRFLARLDRTLGFKDAAVHEACAYGLDRLVAAQYPNGAWPQGFDRPPDPAKFPVKKATYPAFTAADAPQRKDYWTYYTLNDNCLSDVVEALLTAEDVYGGGRYRAAAEKGGGFLILAQMPDQQPAWAQQYDADTYPAWARKFEPPAITGGESQSALETLLLLYRRTSDPKYLEPVPRALAYLKKSLLPDGRLARFYELKTNKPLYFTKDYRLTYSPDNMPTHYGFIRPSRLGAIEAEYRQLAAHGPAAPPAAAEPDPKALAARVRAIIDGLDGRGAWVEKGRLRFHDVEPASGVIHCHTFVENVQALSLFVTGP
jgi:PelA/Pel-15E family pectate lyase